MIEQKKVLRRLKAWIIIEIESDICLVHENFLLFFMFFLACDFSGEKICMCIFSEINKFKLEIFYIYLMLTWNLIKFHMLYCLNFYFENSLSSLYCTTFPPFLFSKFFICYWSKKSRLALELLSRLVGFSTSS